MQGNLTDDGTGFNPTAAFGGKSGGLDRWHEMNPQASGGPSWRVGLPSESESGAGARATPAAGNPAGGSDWIRPNALGGGLSRWYALNPNPAPKGAYANAGLRKPVKPKAPGIIDWEYLQRRDRSSIA